MSTYRRKALELLPELRQRVESAETPADVSVIAQDAFTEALKSRDEDLIRRVLQYNFWCDTDSNDPEVKDAAVCGLWWHIFRYSPQEDQLALLKIVDKWLGAKGLKDVYEKHWKGLVPAYLAERFELEKPGFKDLWGGKI